MKALLAASWYLALFVFPVACLGFQHGNILLMLESSLHLNINEMMKWPKTSMMRPVFFSNIYYLIKTNYVHGLRSDSGRRSGGL